MQFHIALEAGLDISNGDNLKKGHTLFTDRDAYKKTGKGHSVN